MKNLTTKQKIVMSIMAIIIIAGIATTLIIGFNFDLRFQTTKNIELYIGEQFEISDIRSITNEVMPNERTIIQKVEVYEDTVSISAKEITDEQKQNIIQKINEKYELEIQADTTEIEIIPNTRGRDLVKPYIVPFLITTAIILVYMAIKYRKLNWIKVVIKAIITLAMVELTLISLIAITRIPVGRLTIPMGITIYIFTLLALTTNFEKQLEEKGEEEKN